MSDTNTKTVRIKPVRDFADAGTERRFTKGVVAEVTEGEAENYRLGGLVEDAADEPATAEGSEPAKTGRSRG